eukprot:6490447-Amphidinium_carterae.7
MSLCRAGSDSDVVLRVVTNECSSCWHVVLILLRSGITSGPCNECVYPNCEDVGIGEREGTWIGVGDGNDWSSVEAVVPSRASAGRARGGRAKATKLQNINRPPNTRGQAPENPLGNNGTNPRTLPAGVEVEDGLVTLECMDDVVWVDGSGRDCCVLDVL